MNNTNIPKENLVNYSFFKEDVLKTEESKKIRAYMLERAVRLGNAYKGKVKIFFKTIDSLTQSVETTVWAYSADYVTLKGGVFLPIRAIEKVDFD
jgi:hypothetical protein